MAETRAVNLRREAFDVYIGRAGKGQDGYFGNPYMLQEHGIAALDKFRTYFEERLATDEEFHRRAMSLHGKRLGCFCKPGPCHGDIIATWVDAEVGREEWLAATAAECRCCGGCWEKPCGGCQAGGVCDAHPCHCNDGGEWVDGEDGIGADDETEVTGG